jgi:hypothetical protein
MLDTTDAPTGPPPPELSAYLKRWMAVYDLLADLYATPPTSLDVARALNALDDIRARHDAS